MAGQRHGPARDAQFRVERCVLGTAVRGGAHASESHGVAADRAAGPTDAAAAVCAWGSGHGDLWADGGAHGPQDAQRAQERLLRTRRRRPSLRPSLHQPSPRAAPALCKKEAANSPTQFYFKSRLEHELILRFLPGRLVWYSAAAERVPLPVAVLPEAGAEAGRREMVLFCCFPHVWSRHPAPGLRGWRLSSLA